MNEPTLPYLFTPRHYQREVEEAYQRGVRRFITVWPRGSGKDNFWVNFDACRMAETIGIYKHIFPEKLMGRNNWWNEYSNDGFRFLDHFPRELCIDNGRRGRNESEMSVTFINGSVYQVMGADEPDRLRGGNPAGVVFGEYAWHSQLAWPIIEPRILARKGWAGFNSTPDGRDKALFGLVKAVAPHLLRRFMGAIEGSQWASEDLMDDPEWFVSIQTNDTIRKDGGIWKYDPNLDEYSETPEDGGKIYSEADIARMRKQGRSEDWIAQEIYCSFNGARVGSYYGQWMVRARTEGRIGAGVAPWDPRYGVSCVFDLGFTDNTSIWFMQKWGPQVRLIDYFADSGKDFAYYAKILKEKPYRYNSYWAPHDVKQHHLSTGKSTFEVARDCGIYFNLVPEGFSLIDGINAVRALLPRCYFDEGKCAEGIEGLERYKATENKRLGQFETSHPVHDMYSHPADAFRYLALVVDEVQDGAMKTAATQSEGEFDVFQN